MYIIVFRYITHVAQVCYERTTNGCEIIRLLYSLDVRLDGMFDFDDCRSVTAQTIENLPSASREPSEEKEDVILCHVCVKKNEKKKKGADMYCYVCNNVFCDHHSGVRKSAGIKALGALIHLTIINCLQA